MRLYGNIGVRENANHVIPSPHWVEPPPKLKDTTYAKEVPLYTPPPSAGSTRPFIWGDFMQEIASKMRDLLRRNYTFLELTYSIEREREKSKPNFIISITAFVKGNSLMAIKHREYILCRCAFVEAQLLYLAFVCVVCLYSDEAKKIIKKV